MEFNKTENESKSHQVIFTDTIVLEDMRTDTEVSLHEGGDIIFDQVTHQNGSPISGSMVAITPEQFLQIIEAMHGRCFGKFTGVPIQYSAVREQLYAALRDEFGAIRKIAESDDEARRVLEEYYIEGDEDTKHVKVVRMMASVITSELTERFYQNG